MRTRPSPPCRTTATQLGRVASHALLPILTVKATRLLPDDPTVLAVFLLLLLCGQQAAPVPRAPDEAALPLTPSRLLDAREHLTDAALLGAALLPAACGDGDAEAAAAYRVYPAQVTALREYALRVITAWATCRLDVSNLGLVRTMLAAQLSLEQSTIALLPGVVAATARRLAHAGLEDVEALALADPGDLTLPGLTLSRAQQLVCAAERLVDTLTQGLTRESLARDRSDWPLDWQGRTDPVRLRRALTPQVEALHAGYRITGGAVPHHVTLELRCDCPDHTCRYRKHVLAVLLRKGDAGVTRYAELLSGVGLYPFDQRCRQASYTNFSSVTPPKDG